MSDAKAAPTILTTPIARLSFPSLDRPSKMEGSQGAETFNAVLLFTPADFSPADVERWKKIKIAIAQCMRAKFGDAAFDPQTKRLLPAYRNPIRLGTEKPNLAGYGQGVEFLRAASQYKPGLANVAKVEIPPSELYGGCYVRASISPWAYAQQGNKGVSLNLHNMMKIGDGEPFGNVGPTVAQDFGDLTADEMQFDDPAAGIMPGDGAADEFSL